MQKNATTDFPTGYTARRTAASSINNKRDMFFSRETTGNNSSNSATDSSLSSTTNSSSTTTTPSSLLNNSSTKDYYSSYSRTRDNNSYLSSIGTTSTGLTLTSGTQMATSVAGINNGSTNGGSINSIGARDDILQKTTLSKDNIDTPIGFSDIPNQIHRKIVRKGFEFTLMVVGESGMGKSTLVNSLFFTNIYSDEYPGPSKRITKTVQVETTKVLLKQKSVNLQLTIVDTPGYGTSVDNSNCWQPVVEYIESRFEDYLNAETSLYRSSIEDNRVHCCLYFIYPSGHSLKPLDIQFMQNLHDKVNIIPIICKADTLTPEECAQFKKNVLQELAQHQIKYYDFPLNENDEDAKMIKLLRNRMPFAVAGSNYVADINGERKRCRKYPWGIVEVDNLEHCDLSALRDMLIKNYLFDLICTTNDFHYENYRCRKLSGIGSERIGKPNKDVNKNPLAQMEEEKKENEARMKKMEQEMEQVFEMKVKEKLQKLRDSEADLQRRHEQMNRNLEKERTDLEEKRQAFEREKAAFELVSKDMEEMRRVSTLEANSRENLDNKDKKKEKKKGLFQ